MLLRALTVRLLETDRGCIVVQDLQDPLESDVSELCMAGRRVSKGNQLSALAVAQREAVVEEGEGVEGEQLVYKVYAELSRECHVLESLPCLQHPRR
jgi:hypothetical protein